MIAQTGAPLLRAAVLLLVVSMMLIFAFPTGGQPADDIVVNNAKVITRTGITMNQGLSNSIALAGPRVVVEYTNDLRRMGLAALPNPFLTRLDQVTARVVVEYANTIRHNNLAVSTALQTLLGQVSNRIIFQYANTNRNLSLAYPRTLINDTAPPQISNVKAEAMGNDTASITWATDEFADSQVSYGVQSGQYTGTVSDPLYVKQHVITLTAIISGTTYYYQVRSTDQSNNRSTSSENSFKFQPDFHVFLPVVLKQS